MVEVCAPLSIILLMSPDSEAVCIALDVFLCEAFVLLCAFGASINSMSSRRKCKTHLTSPVCPFQYQKLQMRTFRSYLKVQLPWDQEGELNGIWMFHHKALPERSGRGAQVGRGFGVRDGLSMESRAQRIWQQVLTVRGPRDETTVADSWLTAKCDLPNSPSASTVKTKWIKKKQNDKNKNKTRTFPCCILTGV